MISFNASFLVAYGDETRAKGSLASSYIPTFGYPTTAVDLYRTVAVDQTDAPSVGGAFLDIESAAALARLAEGGLSSHRELELAEQALQAILLRETPKVLVPGLKCKIDENYLGRRFDEGQRTEYCFELLKPFGTTDYLFSNERVELNDGVIIGSTCPNSTLTGRKISEITFDQLSQSPTGKAIRYAASDLFGIPVYSSVRDFTDPNRTGSIAKMLYNQINISWERATSNVPPVSFDFAVPPLIAVVLDRIIGQREELGRVLIELRQELAEARQELLGFELEFSTRAASQSDLVARTRRIEEAFSAIVPEAMLTPAQNRKRAILSVFNIARPIYSIAAAFVGMNNVNLASLTQDTGTLADRLVERQRIADRTVCSQVFSRIMDVEAVQQSLPGVITDAELRSIERSLRPPG